MTEICSVYVTFASKKDAREVGKMLVEEKLIACANIIDNVTSIYYWDEALQEDTEAVMFAKTRSELFEAVKDRIKEIHSYENPCILALPIVSVSEAYKKWVLYNCKG